MTRDETIQKLNQLLVLIDSPSTPVKNDFFDSLERPIKPEYKTVDPTYLDGTHKVLKEPNPTRESIKKVYDFINNYILLVVFIGLFSFVWSISKRREYLFLFSVACFLLVFIQIVCGIIIKILPKEITSSKHYDNIRKYQEAVYYNEHEYPELQKQYYVDLEKYERIINSDEYKEYQFKQYTTRTEHDNRIKEASEELGLEFDSDSALKNTVSRLLEIFEKNEELSSIKTALRILEDEKANQKKQERYLEYVEEQRKQDEKEEARKQILKRHEKERKIKAWKQFWNDVSEAGNKGAYGICYGCKNFVRNKCTIHAAPVSGQCVNRK